MRNPHAPPPLHRGVNLPHFLPGCHHQGKRNITLNEAVNPCGVCTGRKEGAPKGLPAERFPRIQGSCRSAVYFFSLVHVLLGILGHTTLPFLARETYTLPISAILGNFMERARFGNFWKLERVRFGNIYIATFGHSWQLHGKSQIWKQNIIVTFGKYTIAIPGNSRMNQIWTLLQLLAISRHTSCHFWSIVSC